MGDNEGVRAAAASAAPSEVLFQRVDPRKRPFGRSFLAITLATGVALASAPLWIGNPKADVVWWTGFIATCAVGSLLLFVVVLVGARERSVRPPPPALTAVAIWDSTWGAIIRGTGPVEFRFERCEKVVICRDGRRTLVSFIGRRGGGERPFGPVCFYDPEDKVRPIVIREAPKKGARVLQNLARGEEPLRLSPHA